MRLEYDVVFKKVDNIVPLDRIQDVSINEDCCNRCTGTTTINIETAGSGVGPEIKIIAPVNASMVRDEIIAKRDAIAAGGISDGVSSSSVKTPLLTSSESTVSAMKESIERIEKLVEMGLEKMNK